MISRFSAPALARVVAAAALLAAFAVASPRFLEAGLVAHYALDDPAGSEAAADSFGRNPAFVINPGEVARGAASAGPALGTCFIFGARGGLNLGPGVEVRPVDRFTLTWWMRPDTLDDFDRIYESLSGTGNDGTGMRIDLGGSPGDSLRVLIRDGNGGTATSHTHSLDLRTDGTWFFCAVRYDSSAGDGSALRLTVLEAVPGAIDAGAIAAATEAAESLGTGPITTHATGAFVAADDLEAADGNDFAGGLDDFAFFDDGDGAGVLTDGELAAVANGGALAFDPPPLPPVVRTFSATPPAVEPGNPAVLAWEVEDFVSLSIDNGVGPVDALTNGGAGSLPVFPAVSTSYTLTAVNGAGTTTATALVTVGGMSVPPVINEFMADNDATLADGDGRFSDWIEIHHAGDAPFDLSGFHLTDDAADLAKWAFPPGTVLAPGEFRLVFASGPGAPTDVDGGGFLHADFALDDGGEYLALVAPDGESVIHEFAPAYPRQFSDVSYGPEGYFTAPTPGARNDPASVLGFVEDTRFSVDRGFHESPFAVEITTATEGAEIRFTLDGTPPAADHGEIYDGPIPVAGTTVLRAAAFKEGFEPSNIDTQTYLFTRDVVRQPELPEGYPSTWAGRRADYEMDPEVVDDPAYAGRFDAALRALPTLSVVMDPDDMFGPRGLYQNPQSEGDAWERPVSAELIVPDGSEPGFQVDCGIRIQGGSSRSPDTPKHSLSLRFREQYGAGKLDYPLFRTQPFGDSAVEEFDYLQLRPEYNHGWMHRHYYQARHAQYNRDQWASDLFVGMGRLGSHGRWVHLYLNGLYWGLYQLHERPDADFMASYLGGTDDEYDTLNSGAVTSGNSSAFNTMISIANGNIASADQFDRIQDYLDVDALVDYMILNFHVGNRDWDGHNWRAGRRREAGAGFLFFPWDTEFAISPNNAGVINSPAPLSAALNTDVSGKTGSGRPTGLHQRLALNAEYRMRFADRAHRHFFNGGVLTPERSREVWVARSTLIDAAIIAESARWGDFRRDVDPGRWSPAQFDLYTKNDHYLPDQAWILEEWFPQRSAITLEQLRRRNLYPDTAAPVFSRHGGLVPPGFELFMEASDTVFYTVDGSDPRLPGGAASPSAVAYNPGIPSVVVTPVVGEGAAAPAVLTTLVPADDALGTSWIAPDFDDSAWRAADPGAVAVGYERSNFGGYTEAIDHDVRDTLMDVNSSILMRYAFDVSEAAAFETLVLRAKIDDGLVAWLNGTLIAVVNAAGEPPLAWDAGAASSTEADLDAFTEIARIDLASRPGLVRDGANVLAIHGLNASTANADFLLVPQLELERTLVSNAEPIVLAGSTFLRARTRSGGEWSALNEAFFNAGELAVTEVMFRPATDERAEFLELANTGGEPVSLAGLRFVEGIRFDFDTGAVGELAPGGRLLLVRDLAAFRAAHGDGHDALVAGEFAEGTALSNDGETLTLEDAAGNTILTFTYNDRSPWPEEADGEGRSLVLSGDRPPEAGRSLDDPLAWRASLSPGGSPGSADGGTRFAGDPAGDANGNGIADLVDYHLASGAPGAVPDVRIEVDAAGRRQLVVVRAHGADDAELRIESSVDGVGWTVDPPGVDLAERSVVVGGLEVLRFDLAAAEADPGLLLRVRVILR